jgi:hypothetical protein
VPLTNRRIEECARHHGHADLIRNVSTAGVGR